MVWSTVITYRGSIWMMLFLFFFFSQLKDLYGDNVRGSYLYTMTAHQCLNLNKLKTIFSSPWLWVFFQTCNVKSLEHQMSRLDCNFCTLRLKLSWLFAFSSYEISKFSEFLLDNLLRSLCLFFAHFPNHTAFFYSRFILRSQRIS